MNNLKELHHTAINQAKYLHDNLGSSGDNLKDNILQFQKKAIQQNPWNSLTFTWQMAQMRKNIVSYITFPLVVSQVFWETWSSVFNPKGMSNNEEGQ